VSWVQYITAWKGYAFSGINDLGNSGCTVVFSARGLKTCFSAANLGPNHPIERLADVQDPGPRCVIRAGVSGREAARTEEE
jgi:hypothetical protein